MGQCLPSSESHSLDRDGPFLAIYPAVIRAHTTHEMTHTRSHATAFCGNKSLATMNAPAPALEYSRAIKRDRKVWTDLETSLKENVK